MNKFRSLSFPLRTAKQCSGAALGKGAWKTETREETSEGERKGFGVGGCPDVPGKEEHAVLVEGEAETRFSV